MSFRKSFLRPKLEDPPEERPEDAPPEPDASVAAVDTDMVPIRIFMPDEVIDAWTARGDGRLSDHLNNTEALSISRVEARERSAGWERIPRSRIVMVVAPPHMSDRQLRVKRHRHPIRAKTEHYSVSGTVHLIPGNRLDRTVIRTRQHFVPLTDVRVARTEGQAEEEHDVVLLNVADTGDGLTLDLLE
jgi:hypothetical protein